MENAPLTLNDPEILRCAAQRLGLLEVAARFDGTGNLVPIIEKDPRAALTPLQEHQREMVIHELPLLAQAASASYDTYARKAIIFGLVDPQFLVDQTTFEKYFQVLTHGNPHAQDLLAAYVKHVPFGSFVGTFKGDSEGFTATIDPWGIAFKKTMRTTTDFASTLDLYLSLDRLYTISPFFDDIYDKSSIDRPKIYRGLIEGTVPFDIIYSGAPVVQIHKHIAEEIRSFGDVRGLGGGPEELH